MKRSWGCWRSTSSVLPSAVSPVASSSGYGRSPKSAMLFARARIVGK